MEAMLLERTLIEGKPALPIVGRLAAILEDELDKPASRDKFWNDARRGLGKLRRLNQRNIVCWPSGFRSRCRSWGLEDLVSKRANRSYRAGRWKDWIAVCVKFSKIDHGVRPSHPLGACALPALVSLTGNAQLSITAAAVQLVNRDQKRVCRPTLRKMLLH
jgi:hypothetical protein